MLMWNVRNTLLVRGDNNSHGDIVDDDESPYLGVKSSSTSLHAVSTCAIHTGRRREHRASRDHLRLHGITEAS